MFIKNRGEIMINNDIDMDIFDEALETIEPREDYNSYSEVIENDALGSVFGIVVHQTIDLSSILFSAVFI